MPTSSSASKSSPHSSHQSSPRFTTICQRFQRLNAIIRKSFQQQQEAAKQAKNEPSLLKSCLILFLQHRKRPRSLYTTINDTDRTLYLDEMPGKAIFRENVGLGLFMLQKGKKTMIPPVRDENKVWRELSLLGIDVKLYLGIRDSDRMDDIGTKLRRLRREVRGICDGLPLAEEYTGNAFERSRKEKNSIERRVEMRSATPKGTSRRSRQRRANGASATRSRSSSSVSRGYGEESDYLLGSSADGDLSPLGKDQSSDPLFSKSSRNASMLRRARSPLVLMRDKSASQHGDNLLSSSIESPLSKYSSTRDSTLSIDSLIQRRAASPLVRIMQEAFTEEPNNVDDDRRSSLSPQGRRYSSGGGSPSRERIKAKRQRKEKQRFQQLAEEYRILSEKYEHEKELQQKIQEWKSKSPTNASRERLHIRFPMHENIHESHRAADFPVSAATNGSELWTSPGTPPSAAIVKQNEFISVSRIEVGSNKDNNGTSAPSRQSNGVGTQRRETASSWTSKQVASYIAKLDPSFGANGVAGAFEDNAIDGQCLQDLNHELLRELGVDKIGHRIKILRGLETLQA